MPGGTYTCCYQSGVHCAPTYVSHTREFCCRKPSAAKTATKAPTTVVSEVLDNTQIEDLIAEFAGQLEDLVIAVGRS